MSCAGDTTLSHSSLSILKPKSCALHNFDTLRHMLIIFGRNKEDLVGMSCARETTPTFFLISSLKTKILCRP